jgi:hypothetical protein
LVSVIASFAVVDARISAAFETTFAVTAIANIVVAIVAGLAFIYPRISAAFDLADSVATVA